LAGPEPRGGGRNQKERQGKKIQGKLLTQKGTGKKGSGAGGDLLEKKGGGVSWKRAIKRWVQGTTSPSGSKGDSERRVLTPKGD